MSKQTIEELRNELVDYTDTTPNEPRYIKPNILDDTVFYPLGNQYYNTYTKDKKFIKIPAYATPDTNEIKKELFINKLNFDRISYAIKFLQVEALKKYVIKNYKSVLLSNPFSLLYFTFYPVNENMEATKEIIKILIENYDDYYELISNLGLLDKSKEYIYDLLLSFLPNDENNICSICLTTEPKQYLINPCLCKTPIHIKCILVIHTHKKLKNCSVCLGKYMINEPIHRNLGLMEPPAIDPAIFFPYHDFYYEPLLNLPYPVKISGMSRLTMAIMYLQVKRVKQLLEEKEVLDNLGTYYFGYEPYKQTPIIALCQGNMPSNCDISYGNNQTKYMQIIKMLLETKKIDLNVKDAFGKDYKDYIKARNLGILTYVFKMYG